MTAHVLPQLTGENSLITSCIYYAHRSEYGPNLPKRVNHVPSLFLIITESILSFGQVAKCDQIVHALGLLHDCGGFLRVELCCEREEDCGFLRPPIIMKGGAMWREVGNANIRKSSTYDHLLRSTEHCVQCALENDQRSALPARVSRH